MASSLALLLGVPPPAYADAVRDSQWHLKFLDIAAAHRITQGQGVVVGLPDTGVDVRDQDLADAVIGGAVIGDFGDERRDSIGHGTAMAGLIAGRGHGVDNKDGVLGIAP